MSIPLSEGDLSTAAVAREPIARGASEVPIERLTFADGSMLVLKQFSVESDWMMRATHDTGRAAELWLDGSMDALPDLVDPAIVSIERDGSWWRLYLRDISARFIRRGTAITSSDVKSLLTAVASMHRVYADRAMPRLATLTDYYRLTAPDVVAQEDPGDSEFLGTVKRGWEVFDELVPRDVSTAVDRLLVDPTPLARALEATGNTLCHGDLHYGNVAPLDDRFVVLDWTLAVAAPPAVDFCWYLDQSAALIEPTREEAIALFREAEGDLYDDRSLRLAMVGELLAAGWQAIDALHPDRGPSRRENLTWWVARAREGLELLY